MFDLRSFFDETPGPPARAGLAERRASEGVRASQDWDRNSQGRAGRILDDYYRENVCVCV